jgi:transcriptional regulator with XRE-family HTH domain
MSQNALARASGVDPANVNRYESGKRPPSNRAHVEQLAGALGLGAEERDELLASAGHAPDVYERVGLSDPTLRAVAAALGDEELSSEDRSEFRAVVEALARRWRAGTGGGRR